MREQGLSLTAHLGPGVDGRGLSLFLTPRWGTPTDGGVAALWGEGLPGLSGHAPGEAASFDARVGYGIALAPGGVLTPFAEAGVAEHDGRRIRLGSRFEVSRAALALELSGEERESASAGSEQALWLDLRLTF